MKVITKSEYAYPLVAVFKSPVGSVELTMELTTSEVTLVDVRLAVVTVLVPAFTFEKVNTGEPVAMGVYENVTVLPVFAVIVHVPPSEADMVEQVTAALKVATIPVVIAFRT